MSKLKTLRKIDQKIGYILQRYKFPGQVISPSNQIRLHSQLMKLIRLKEKKGNLLKVSTLKWLNPAKKK